MNKAYLTVLLAVAVGGIMFVRPWNRSSENDAVRYKKLVEACQTQYEADIAAGKQFFAYPCSDDQLRTQFRQKYGHGYDGK
ncbi:hypothetical protein IPL68_02030 [Candidatus Saccharibacteria bacterium]|nr:MAG: hypothetical protein IPL68_02030 [Candidatus Saccharibacteria bacterium]